MISILVPFYLMRRASALELALMTLKSTLEAPRALNSSSALTILVMMKRCLIALFDGVLVQKPGEPNFQYPQHEVEQIAETFFLKWLEIFPKHARNRDIYVAGLSGIQIALALTVNHLMKERKISHLVAIELLTDKCSLQHTDPIFDFLYSQEENVYPDIRAVLPSNG